MQYVLQVACPHVNVGTGVRAERDNAYNFKSGLTSLARRVDSLKRIVDLRTPSDDGWKSSRFFGEWPTVRFDTQHHHQHYHHNHNHSNNNNNNNNK